MFVILFFAFIASGASDPRSARPGFILLPGIPTRATPCTQPTLTQCPTAALTQTPCSCAVATCGTGQFCINSGQTGQCTSPVNCTTQPTVFPCICNTSICTQGKVCNGGACIDPLNCVVSANPVQIPCICGAETCTVGQFCSPTGGCLDRLRSCGSGMLQDPCMCGTGNTMVNCTSGQTCDLSNPIPEEKCGRKLCDGAVPLQGCVCGGVEICTQGQTCENGTCTPAKCPGSTSPVLIMCACGDGRFTPAPTCNPGQRCVLGDQSVPEPDMCMSV